MRYARQPDYADVVEEVLAADLRANPDLVGQVMSSYPFPVTHRDDGANGDLTGISSARSKQFGERKLFGLFPDRPQHDSDAAKACHHRSVRNFLTCLAMRTSLSCRQSRAASVFIRSTDRYGVHARGAHRAG